ncbi:MULTISPECIES: AAA family ATPase [unclassified Nocardiopsis]|uniref:cytidylate kinase-like family protein n=1 Tax=Nocardiopsis TaxID=2013 RepID=UPI00387B2669
MSSERPRPVVTISATYGAGGAVVGPAVAAALGVVFLDRAVPSAVAGRIGCSLDEALQHDDRSPGGLERLLTGAVRLPTVTLGSVDTAFVGTVNDEGRLLYDHEFVEHTEQVIGEVAHTGGVVLGRAGAIVLADHPTALHVRLDGAPEARLERAREQWESGASGGVGDTAAPSTRRPPPPSTDAFGAAPPTARIRDDNDRARAAYVRRFYRTDAASPRHYHMVLDGTVLSAGACADVIVRAARDRASGKTG